MTGSIRETAQRVVSLLTPAEREHAIVYANLRPLAAGEVVKLGPEHFESPFPAIAVFIDQDPTANWTHACRLVLMDTEGDRVYSSPGHFPPLSKDSPGDWRLAYKAPSVPDSFVLVGANTEESR